MDKDRYRKAAAPARGGAGRVTKDVAARACRGLLCLLLLAACTKDGLAPLPPDGDGGRVLELVVRVPATSAGQTRALGDPGEAAPEGADWDELAVLVVFEDDGDQPGNIVRTVFSKDDFDQLPAWPRNEAYRLLSLPLSRTEGMAYIYGVTYSTDAANAVGLRDAILGCETHDAVKSLTVSNDYAAGDPAKFVSVATGFYQGHENGQDDSPTGKPVAIDITTLADAGMLPTMTLYRLAAKVDVQWDASDDFWVGYSEVRLTGFTLSGGNSNIAEDDSGSGRLFPSLYEGSEGLTGSKTFTNTTPVSQRNGRVYHYVFPDGVSKPQVAFHIAATRREEDDQTLPVKNDYTLQLPALQQATWYKVNATINGLSGSGTIEVDFEGDNNP